MLERIVGSLLLIQYHPRSCADFLTKFMQRIYYRFGENEERINGNNRFNFYHFSSLVSQDR